MTESSTAESPINADNHREADDSQRHCHGELPCQLFAAEHEPDAGHRKDLAANKNRCEARTDEPDAAVPHRHVERERQRRCRGEQDGVTVESQSLSRKKDN